MNPAKQLYLSICPLLERSLVAPDFDALDPFSDDLSEITQEVKQIDDFCWYASTAWHALAFCIGVRTALASGIMLDESYAHIKDISELGGKTAAVHVLFRGQSNSTWGLQPTIWRNEKDIENNKLAIAAFCRMMKYALEKESIKSSFPAQLHCATAQHYHIPTPLLDWTADPAVAVAFAATGKQHSDAQKAAVYILPMVKAVENHARFYLPPPYVERLFLQRGVFTETLRGESEKLLQDCACKVIFPLDSQFKLMRRGLPVILEPPDRWIESVVEWAKKEAAAGHDYNGTSVKEIESSLEPELQKLGLPDYLRREKAESLAQAWAQRTLDMLTVLTEFEPNGKRKVNPSSLNACVRDNMRLLRPLSEYLRKISPPDKHDYPDLIDNLIHQQTAVRAFEIWQESGKTHGHDRQDWSQAEADVN